MTSIIAKMAAILDDSAKPMGAAKTPTLPGPSTTVPKIKTSVGTPKWAVPSISSSSKGVSGPSAPTAPTAPTSSSDSGSSSKQAASMDEGVSPLLLGLGGGAGGYLAGKHLVNPLLDSQAKSIQAKILQGQQVIKTLEKAQKAMPLIGGAIGAIVLASIAAKKARKDERNKLERSLMWNTPEVMEYLDRTQPSNGFRPDQRTSLFY